MGRTVDCFNGQSWPAGMTNFDICDSQCLRVSACPCDPPGPPGCSHTRQAGAHILEFQSDTNSPVTLQEPQLDSMLNCGCRGNSLMQILPGQIGFYQSSQLHLASCVARGGWSHVSGNQWTSTILTGLHTKTRDRNGNERLD